jgi:hypothetical protein
MMMRPLTSTGPGTGEAAVRAHGEDDGAGLVVDGDLKGAWAFGDGVTVAVGDELAAVGDGDVVGAEVEAGECGGVADSGR